jgi:hypothetical protein
MERQRDYTSIQLTPSALNTLRKKKKPSETYEEYLRRKRII